MKEVDLHSVKHDDVDSIIIDACAKSDFPFVVITGNSQLMKEIVEMAVVKMGCRTVESIGNPGRLIVHEDR